MTTLLRFPMRFTQQDADEAAEEWGFNCGPAAICAIVGLGPAGIRPHLLDFEKKRYMNPSLMFSVLSALKVSYRLETKLRPGTLRWPRFGLARVQWEGPWTNNNVPIKARYRHTHWVGACYDHAGEIGIFDVNCLNNGTGWVGLYEWKTILVPWLLRECHPHANGKWHLTHSLEIQRPSELNT